jgi:hypothetical protein
VEKILYQPMPPEALPADQATPRAIGELTGVVRLSYAWGMSEPKTITIRVKPQEREAWLKDAERRGMEDLSQWVRSACATFLVCGKRTVTVPAEPEPEYVEELRAEIAEVKRLTLELQERTSVYEKLSVAVHGDTASRQTPEPK